MGGDYCHSEAWLSEGGVGSVGGGVLSVGGDVMSVGGGVHAVSWRGCAVRCTTSMCTVHAGYCANQKAGSF
jgi:hypothetical protein